MKERPEGVVDEAVQGHAPGLGHDHFDGGLAGAVALGEHIDDEKEQQLVIGAGHAPAGRRGGWQGLALQQRGQQRRLHSPSWTRAPAIRLALYCTLGGHP
jgi:hypothetical protein